uniref:Mitochondrial resolvase Ydc2 catalytic domain-containing protein n=1 Tax=viral metagenome TaxID=1070528 RepID=A0A6C0ELH5_9ZZZZ
MSSAPLSLVTPSVGARHIVSFDIGIKNLAYCFLVEDGSRVAIQDWTLVDLLHQDQERVGPPTTCTCAVGQVRTGKSGSGGTSADLRICGKLAKWTHPQGPSGEYYCEVHAKARANAQNGWLIPKLSYTRSKLNTLNRDKLAALVTACAVAVPPTPRPTKAHYIEALCDHFQRVCYVPVGTQGPAPLSARQTDLITLGRNMIRQLDARAAAWSHPPTHVLLENQISTIASRMMTIQGELMMYFLMRYPGVHIEFVSSKNKLKGFSAGDQGAAAKGTEDAKKHQAQKYKEHKRDAVIYTRQLLATDPRLTPWEPTLDASKKKDDLCDCFLQGMWFIQK